MPTVSDPAFRKLTWPILIALYFTVQLVVRIFIGPSLELDEAEARFFSESLDLGYGAQPPLYFWLQWLLFQIVGPGIASLALLKAIILTATLWQVWRFLAPYGPVAASIGSLSLGLLPEIVWESQRALTHTTLVVCLTVTAVVACHRVLTRGTWSDHVVLGLVLGAGQLSKSNFALVAVTLLLTMASRSAWRDGLYPHRLGAAIAIAAVVAAPVPIFTLLHPDLALASLHKLGIAGDEVSAFARGSQGLTALVMAIASVLALPAVVLACPMMLRWLRSGNSPETPRDDRLAFLLRFSLVGLCVVFAFVIASGATEVRARWLLPLLWPLVVMLSVWLALGASRRAVVAGRAVLASFWVVAAGALPWASLVDPGYRAADFSTLVAHLEPGDAVLSDSVWILGNLTQFEQGWSLTVSKDPLAEETGNVAIVKGSPRTSTSGWSMVDSVEIAVGRRSMNLLIARRVE